MAVNKCLFCNQPGAQVPGYVLKLKPKLAHGECAAYYESHRFGWLKITEAVAPAINTATLNKDSRNKLKENLTRCACGHQAEWHEEDEQGNLLECQGYNFHKRNFKLKRECECSHFYYSIPQTRNGDLVVLSEAIESTAAETKLAKLRAVTVERGATLEEELAATKRINTLLENELGRAAA